MLGNGPRIRYNLQNGYCWDPNARWHSPPTASHTHTHTTQIIVFISVLIVRISCELLYIPINVKALNEDVTCYFGTPKDLKAKAEEIKKYLGCDIEAEKEDK